MPSGRAGIIVPEGIIFPESERLQEITQKAHR